MIENILKQITAEYSLSFYFRQVITILVLFLYGYFVCLLLFFKPHGEVGKLGGKAKKTDGETATPDEAAKTDSKGAKEKCQNVFAGTSFIYIIYPVLLAFPVGVSILGICGLLILISGIKYCVLSVVLSMAAFLAVLFALKYMSINARSNSFNKSSNSDKAAKSDSSTVYKSMLVDITQSVFKPFIIAKSAKPAVITTLAVIIIALISVSGVISTGFTNDSMYYYSEYPRAIVSRGGLYYGFDVNLTDAGQTTVVLNTLPYLFGFNETFGIHAFFNINFILFFAYAIYEQASKRFSNKKSLAFSGLFTLLLITSMPFLLISKWNIANVYFMEQMFICLCLYFMSDFMADYETIDITPIETILLLMLSFMRIEGSVYVILVLACALTLKNVGKRSVMIPAAAVFVFQALYFAKIFIFTELYASFTFMTKGKAASILLIFIAFIIYAYLFADSDKIIYNKLNKELLYIVVLMLANIVVFLYDKASYGENIKSLIMNVRGSGGWGIFPAVIIALIILVPKIRIKTLYFDLFYICFALISLIACALRGGTMRISFADSGNRVFLQIVPFIIFAFAYRYIVGFKILEDARKT